MAKKEKARQQYKCVVIQWVDINSFDGAWLDIKESKKLEPVNMETIGWIIHETKDYVVIVSTFDSSGDLAGSTNAIPKGIITKIIPVKDVKLS
tara:strand:+ start:600 stop:878 length:279 start_codon:yes stop_codon:yes gene_type:complete